MTDKYNQHTSNIESSYSFKEILFILKKHIKAILIVFVIQVTKLILVIKCVVDHTLYL